MGWDEVGNLDNFKSKDVLKQVVAQTAEEVWNKEWDTKTTVKYVTDQHWAFKNNITKGDIFIV